MREPVIHRSEPRSEHVGSTSKPRPCPPAMTRRPLLHAGGKGKGYKHMVSKGRGERVLAQASLASSGPPEVLSISGTRSPGSLLIG